MSRTSFSWQLESNYKLAIKIILFLLSPVVGLVYSFGSLRTKSTYWIIFLFCLCFGISFTVSNQRTEGSIDGITYRAEFEEMVNDSYVSFKEDFSEYLTFDTGDQDFYFNSLAFGVSRFSSNYHVFFFFVALIFAFFQLRTVRFFTLHSNYRDSLFCFILFGLFIWNHIFNINGLRFWTAAWIAMYSCFQLLVCKNKAYLVLALLTPFVHGSYFLYLIVLAIYFLFGRFEKAWIILFLFSFVVSTISVELTQSAMSFLPDVFSRKVEFYTDARYIEERATGSGFWFIDKFFKTLTYIYVNVLVCLLIFKNGASVSSDSNRSLLRFLVILISFANIFMPVPSVGGRFIQLTYPMIAYLWLSYFSNKKYSWVVYCLPFVWFMNLYHMFVQYIGVLDISFVITSPIYSVLKSLLI